VEDEQQDRQAAMEEQTGSIRVMLPTLLKSYKHCYAVAIDGTQKQA